ncbi:MAG: membrane protein insertase YidC, partial [Candidatus Moranbacteria bacterium]|nr:membrane protein insertase YidC [Candidatus Moranbacteria bacterium]
MSQIFHSGIFEPLYNTLVFLYNTIPGQDLGIAIIVLTVATKAIMLPLSKKQIESQKHMQELQPQIKEIQKKYKENKEKQTKELMKFYKEHKVNPLSGCLPIIVQLIVLIGVYQILLTLSRENLMVNGENLYAFIQNPGQINHMFIGLIDLAKPSIVLAVMAAVGQYYQVKMMLQKKAVADEKKKEKIVKKEEKETEA